MREFLRWCRVSGVWLGFAAFAIVIAVITPYLKSREDQAHLAYVQNCRAINIDRREGLVRAHVLKAFLLDAARAREDAAVREEGVNRRQSVADHMTAQHYLELRARIHILPIRTCH